MYEPCHLQCDALRDLVPFVQFKKRGKYPWVSVTFGLVLKVTLLYGCFSRFKNCTNGTKSSTHHICNFSAFLSWHFWFCRNPLILLFNFEYTN